jgi:hypothetical protein
MKTRTILLALLFCVAGAVVAFASDSTLGTWKLNEAKSKIPAGAAKNNTVVYSMDGDNYKCTIDGVDASGNPTHNEWTGKFDGKDYPVTGDASSDTRSYHKVDARHYKFSGKKDGKTTYTGTIVYTADGKSRTVTQHTTDAKGKKVTFVGVYEKQ